MMARMLAAAALVVACVWTGAAFAAPITFTLDGKITEVIDASAAYDANVGAAAGDSFKVVMVVDSNTPDQTSNSIIGNYFATSMTVTIKGDDFTYSPQPGLNYSVANDLIGADGLQWHVDNPDSLGFQLDVVTLALRTNNTALFSSDAFVETVPDLSTFEINKASFRFNNFSTTGFELTNLTGLITSVSPTVSDVPEPAGLTLFGGWLAGLALTRRIRAKCKIQENQRRES